MDENYANYLYNRDLQQQSGEQQAALYAPQMQEQIAQAQAVLVTETNPNRVIREIELTLRNQEEDYKGDIIQVGEPIMNDYGISRMKFIMKSVINQNTILSHLDEKVIGKLIIKLADDLTDDLTLNWREYGIKHKVYLDHIVNAISFSAYFSLMRAFGQNEKNWLKGITVENISGGRPIQAPKKGGFWDKFKL